MLPEGIDAYRTYFGFVKLHWISPTIKKWFGIYHFQLIAWSFTHIAHQPLPWGKFGCRFLNAGQGMREAGTRVLKQSEWPWGKNISLETPNSSWLALDFGPTASVKSQPWSPTMNNLYTLIVAMSIATHLIAFWELIHTRSWTPQYHLEIFAYYSILRGPYF